MLRFNKVWLASVFFLFNLSKCLSLSDNTNSLNTTDVDTYLQHFHNEFYLNKVSQLTIIRSVRDEKAAYYLNDLMSEYTKILSDTKVLLKNVNAFYKNSFSYFNTIFIDSFESFREINLGPKTETEDFSEYYLIVYYSPNKNPELDIQQIFDYCWQYYTVNVVLLLKTQDERPIFVYTYYPFTQHFCRKAQVHIMNQNKSIMELKASDIFPNKFKTFHNCPLAAAVWNVAPYLTLPPSGSSTKKMSGVEGLVLNTLSEVLQFKVDYVTPPNNEQRGLVKEDGTMTGAIKMLSERVADLSLGCFRCTLQRSTILSPSSTFYQTHQVFTVLSLRQPWASLAIIAFPFQLHIWIVILILMLLVLSSTLILQFYRPCILRFIYGFGSANLININIVAIALNQTALCVPRRNFARHILLMWIILTMVLRSIYQGALYDFLKSQQNKAPPDTVAQLIERKFKLIINVATNDSFSGTQIMRDRLIEVIIMNITDDGGFSYLEANPDKSYVTGTPKDFLTHYVKTHNKYGVFHVLRESIFSQHLCIYFSKHSYLVNVFNNILQNLETFGMINQWANQLMDSRFLEQINESTAKAPLHLNQLLGIIEIALYLYSFAIIVFICEIIWFKLKANK